ncbi:hypothetical protein EXIGLDRAFT_692377 [Exidia glandulosa HHB12029]|uniref:Uncharacterized protein n=1 Tax=Exidia glandulosa HHB12029 TaxID=1314781 RepID=A0A165I342_EXIGL|nr:hypothetical protein EXIGLDRAFT_692377 [Exidia glandulosa HHB12029]
MSGNFMLDPDLAFAVTQRTAEIVFEGTRRLHIAAAHTGHVPLPDFFSVVRRRFEETMWNLARGSNMGPFPRRVRLPDEVWFMVWQDLPLVDRLRVTHVCHDWRRLALGTPLIWCDIDLWVYRHPDACKCDDCSLTPGLHPMLSNARLVRHVLSLSQKLPLYVTFGDRDTVFELGFSSECRDAVKVLVGALEPHAGRIAALHGTLASPFVMTMFFESVSAFPRLVSMSVTTSNPEALGVPLYRTVVSFPQLRTLHITGGWANWLLDNQVFPAVATLRVTFAWTNATLALIRACPSIECLELWIPDRIDGRERQRDEFVAAVKAIPHVRLLNMTNRFDMHLGMLINDKSRPRYECVYTKPPSYTMHFLALDDTESFFCTRQGDMIVLRAETSSRSGRKIRTFSFPFEEKVEMAPLWENFEPDALKHITCDATLWYLVTECMPRFKFLISLTLTFTESESFADYKSGLGDPPDIDKLNESYYLFPALRTVTFRKSSGGTVELPEWWCEAFLETLELDEDHHVKFRRKGVTLRYDRDYESDMPHPSELILPRLMKPILRRGCAAQDQDEDELEEGDEEVIYDHEAFASAYLSSLADARDLAF